MDLGSYLRMLREAKRFSVRRLAALAKVSNGYLSQIETGQRGIPSPIILRKLARPLGVPYEELLTQAGYLDKADSSDLLIDHLSPDMQAFVRREVAAGCPWLHVIKEMVEKGLTVQDIEQVLSLFVRVKGGAERKADSGSQPDYAPPPTKS